MMFLGFLLSECTSGVSPVIFKNDRQAMGWESVFVGGFGLTWLGLHVGVDPVNEVGSLCVHSWVARLSAPDHNFY